MLSEEPPLEAPNWLKELEAKRERRVKAKLGHETGAGAPCLACAEKCPGLDLHFWRKICKNCKCSKEEHDVPDDDVHGWAEWQLLGSKPQKIKTKITLPGRKGEVELEWAPKGAQDTVEQFLRTLPPEQIPIKGSQAALDRKMQLQKQIPVHDIDPGLCHDLTDQELEEMQKYIAHVKEKSVGVGQLVRLGHLVRGVLHNLGPEQARILTEKYGKNVPFYEIVKLQNQLQSNQLVKDLDKLNINKSAEVDNLGPKKGLPDYGAGMVGGYCDNQSPRKIGNFKDLAYSTYEQQDNVENSQDYSPNHNQRLGPNLGGKLEGQLPQYGHKITDYSPRYGQETGQQPSPQFDRVLPTYKQSLPGYKQRLPSYEESLANCNKEVQNSNAINQQLPQFAKDLAQFKQGLATDNKQGLPGYKQSLPGYKDGLPVLPPYDQSLPPYKQKLPPYNKNLPQYQQKLPNYSQGLAQDNQGSTENNPDLPGYKQGLPGYNQGLPSYNQTLPSYKQTVPPYNQNLPQYNPELPQNEQNLQPTNVQIGAIRDIYPDIKRANFGQNENFIENLPKPQEATTTIIDNLVIPNCHGCQKPFELEEFAVTIEKSNNLYHASCFKCAGCHQILADNMYFYHKETNNIYCLRDYAKVKGYPRCKGCDELIFTKEYCLTEENTFHLKHFCCIECDTPLAGQNYLEENSHPMCLPCYENSKANRCQSCQKVIKPDEKGLVLKDSHFHVTDQCFCCKICRKPLLDQKLLFRDLKLYCSHQCHQQDQPQQ